MFDQMKTDQKLLTASSKVYRQDFNRFKRKNRSYRGNYPKWEEAMNQSREARMSLRFTSRYLGLARAFLKDKHYKSVENSTRDGNEAEAAFIVSTLYSYGYNVSVSRVNQWLEAA